MTPARGVEDVEPGIVNPGGPPLPPADTSAGGHPRKKKKYLFYIIFQNLTFKPGNEPFPENRKYAEFFNCFAANDFF